MKPLIVGLTGGMGAGKSTVLDYLRRGGVQRDDIFDCDAAVHDLYEHYIMVAWLTDKFGDMKGNARKTCTALVMEDEQVLDTLQNMFIPLIENQIQQKIKDRLGLMEMLIIDAPLLFETGMNKICDKVVVVNCPEEVRIERVMQRPGMTVEKCNLLLSRQLTDAERLTQADYVIDTHCSFDETKMQVAAFLKSVEEDSFRG